MTATPVHTLRVAAAAARRAMVRDVVFAAGRGLSLGAGAGGILIATGKLGVALPTWPVLLGTSVGVGAVGAAVWALFRRWSAHRAAAELDHRLGLKDRLSSALALAGPGTEDPFADWSIVEAERAAATVRPAHAIPVRLDWPWGVWPVLLAGAVALAVLVPQRQWHAPSPRPEPTQAQRTQAAAQIAQAADAIRQGLDNTPAATAKELAELEQLERELAQGRADPDEAAVQAAKHVEDLASRLEADAAERQRQADSLREHLAKAAGEAGAEPGEAAEPLSPLMDALRKGDMQAAAEAAAAAAEREPVMSSAEREQLARELEELATAIEREPDPAAAPGEPPPEVPKATESESPAEPLKSPPATGENRSPPESGERPPSAQPETAQREQQKKSFVDAVRDAVKELTKPPAPKPPADAPPPSGDRPREGDAQREPSKGAEGEGQKPQPAPEGRQGATGSDGPPPPERTKPPSGQPGASGATQAERPTGTPAEGQQGTQAPTGQPRGQPGTTGQPERTQGQSAPSGQALGQQGSTGQRGTTGSDSPSGASGATGAQPGTGTPDRSSSGPQGPSGSVPGPGEQPGPDSSRPEERPSPDGAPRGNAPETGERSPDASGMERVARELRRLRDGGGQPDQERVRQLREMAQKMLDESTPEQREQLRKLAQGIARRNQDEGHGGSGDRPSPFGNGFPNRLNPETMPLDARQPATVSGQERPPERTIAQWYSDKPLEPGATGAAPAQVFREAAQSAERAIEGRQVPPRYQDLVRRVFRRYSEQPTQK